MDATRELADPITPVPSAFLNQGEWPLRDMPLQSIVFEKQDEVLGRWLRAFHQWFLHLQPPCQVLLTITFLLFWLWIEWPAALKYFTHSVGLSR